MNDMRLLIVIGAMLALVAAVAYGFWPYLQTVLQHFRTILP